MLIHADILLLSIAFIWLAAACITDIRKREVPDWLSFSLIAIALAIRGITALIASEPFYFFYALIALAIFFALANILYYGKVLGGGDSKLLIALAAVFATTPVFIKTSDLIAEPFLLGFVVNIFIFGFFYALIFSIYSAIKYKKDFSAKFKKEYKKIRHIRLVLWTGAIITLIISFFSTAIFRPLILLLFVILFIAPLLYSFIRAVENTVMIKKISPSKLSEGDWLVHSIKLKIKNKTKIIKPSVHGLSKEDIALLKKVNKKVVVRIGLLFIPIFIIALICSLLLGNLLTRFILLFI